MHKRDAPDGWRLLDDYHSGNADVRYVKKLSGNRRAVVDLWSYGKRGTTQAVAAVEGEVLKDYQEGEGIQSEELASDVATEDAYETAFDFMRDPPEWARDE